MAKKICVVCGKELGLLSGKIAISDGVVCTSCLHEAGISSLQIHQSYTTSSITDVIKRRTSLVHSFSATKSIGSYLKVDENSKTFMIGGDIFEYMNLLSFELLEDGQTITKGGLGRAVAGGLLFGGVGAIVGGVTGGKKSKGICNSMKIRVTLKNAHTDTVYINLILTETKTKGLIYNAAQSNAQSCISALQIIADENESNAPQSVSNQTVSSADEILKFKNLLDSGIITQEEFETKKKQLLGL